MDISEVAAKDWFKCTAKNLELSNDKPQLVKKHKNSAYAPDYLYVKTVDRKHCLCWSMIDNSVMITKINAGVPLIVTPILFRPLTELISRWEHMVSLSKESTEKSNLAQANQFKFNCDELVFDIIM